MRISELSARAGIATATIKYYLREGLLPPGELTSATQARYNEQHVERLRLVRALLGPAKLTVARVRDVLRVIDEPGADMFTALGAAQHATLDEVEAVDTSVALALVERAGWRVDPSGPELAQLARALHAADDADFEIPEGVLDAHINAAARVAEAELAHMPEDPRHALRYAVLGTILAEPLLSALRRLAEQSAAADRFGPAT
ncbi:transcriptional regulator [Microbacterium faecale]|uniref:Transcriptional regulator n=1 Tax=Microbacterium faecale TaxID=1804630 RepID=A0A916Y0A5_9MICO|nr:MerR family transcriptional regulator [Microbacterium faecale]GGD25305.1 transcriptional regulator [Microbacterium faecale]